MENMSLAALAAAPPLLLKPRSVFAMPRADGGDIRALIAEVKNSHEAFKQAYDEKLKAKVDDVVLSEKVDRINAAVGSVQALIDEMAIKQAAAAMGAGQRPVRDREYSDAFAAHVRKGELQASLNKGASDQGGFLTPIEWDRSITDRLVIVSQMRQIATVQSISVAGFTKLFNNRGVGSGWVGETAARPETTTPTLGQMTYSVGEIYANPSATQQLLDDAEVDAEAWLADNVETEFSFQEGIAFVAGNGVNKPAGFLTYATGAANAAVHPWGAIGVTTAAAATSLTSDEVLNLTYALPQAYTDNARFVLNRASLAKIRTIKDAGNNYIWQPSYSEGQPQTIGGYPITEMAAMPNMVSGAIPLAFGDFKRGYLIIDRIGVRVLRDPYTNKPFVMFYTTKRVGGGLLNPDAIKLIKMA